MLQFFEIRTYKLIQCCWIIDACTVYLYCSYASILYLVEPFGKAFVWRHPFCPTGKIKFWHPWQTPHTLANSLSDKQISSAQSQADDLFRTFSKTLCWCSQAPWVLEDKRPPPEWPMEGNVEFHDYSVRYREGLDLVLKKLNMSVKGGEKVRRRWLLNFIASTQRIINSANYFNSC